MAKYINIHFKKRYDRLRDIRKIINIIREIKIKITLRYHLTPTTISKIKKTVQTNVYRDVEQLELLYTVGRSINGSTIWKSLAIFYKQISTLPR